MMRSVVALLLVAACGSSSQQTLANSPSREVKLNHPLDYSRPFSHSSDLVVESHCVWECAGAAFHDIRAARELCETTDVCYQLGTILRKQGDELGARDAFERECQYRRDPRICDTLADGYDLGWFPEPVAGRAKQLRKWACSVLPPC